MDQQQPEDRSTNAPIVPNAGSPGETPTYDAQPVPHQTPSSDQPPHWQQQPPPPWQQQPPPHPQWQHQPPPYGYYQPQPIYVTQQVQMAPTAVAAPPKSMAVALLLTFFFGPLGLFYASVTGGVVMLLVSIVVAIATLGFGLLITGPLCMVWAAIAVNNANAQIGTTSYTQNSR